VEALPAHSRYHRYCRYLAGQTGGSERRSGSGRIRYHRRYPPARGRA